MTVAALGFVCLDAHTPIQTSEPNNSVIQFIDLMQCPRHQDAENLLDQ